MTELSYASKTDALAQAVALRAAGYAVNVFKRGSRHIVQVTSKPDEASVLDRMTSEARTWLTSAFPGEIPKSTLADDISVIGLIKIHYPGGWTSFTRGDRSADVAVVWLLMVRRYGLAFANSVNAES